MEAKTIELHVAPNPRDCKVIIDGVDTSWQVDSFEVKARVGRISEIVINGFAVDMNGKFYADPKDGHPARFVIKGRFVEDSPGGADLTTSPRTGANGPT